MYLEVRATDALHELQDVVESTIDMVATFDGRLTWQVLSSKERYRLRFENPGTNGRAYVAEITSAIAPDDTAQISCVLVDPSGERTKVQAFDHPIQTARVREELTLALVHWYGHVIHATTP
jgi:hypothetical protein